MNKAPTLYGEPAKNIVSNYVHQQYNDTCAIKSQQLVLEKYGIYVSEDQLRTEAYSHGWYSPGGGTSMNDVGKLLELHGIGVNQYVNGNIFNVINELAQGHNVIMGVDSGELWHYGLYEKIEDQVLGPRADHALIVSGINTEDPQNIKVIIIVISRIAHINIISVVTGPYMIVFGVLAAGAHVNIVKSC